MSSSTETSESSSESEVSEPQPPVESQQKTHLRDTRLAQLARAREVALENKRKRREPTQRRQAIQKNFEAKLYERDIAEVERLESLVSQAESKSRAKAKPKRKPAQNPPETSHKGTAATYMDQLIRELYS